jgi:hypothetical protein
VVNVSQIELEYKCLHLDLQRDDSSSLTMILEKHCNSCKCLTHLEGIDVTVQDRSLRQE